MKMKRYITLDQLIIWATTTSPFVFEGVEVNPEAQWEAINSALFPFLNGSMDNPYSTSNPKEKLPTYFSHAEDIGIYLSHEYESRLVAVPFCGGEYYPKLQRNLNKDEAMEVILASVLSKTYSFISIYGYQFIKKIGLAGIKYNPIWNVDGTETTTYDYGNHVTDNEYGARLRTDNLGNTSQTTNYGGQQLTDQIGGTTTTHSETQMNDLTFKPKTQDSDTGHTDTHTTTTHSDTTTTNAVINTSGDAAVKDTTTDKQHQNVETKERHGNIGVTSTQELLKQEISLLDFNPAIEFLNAFTDKILLRAYCY